MPRTATARKITKTLDRRITVEEALANPKILKGLSKECFSCDPYNPTRVERAKCPDCKGSGYTPVEFVGIVNDAKQNRKAKDAHTAQAFDEGDE
jgi:hypothetical protein